MPPPLKVIFACVHNAGRSQMAAAWFNRLADPQKAVALSAGTNPGERVHPEVLEVMAAEGFDLQNITPQKLTESLASDTAWLITMGCGENCPFIPGAKTEDWPLEDPKGKDPQTVHRIQEEIKTLISTFIDREGLSAPA